MPVFPLFCAVAGPVSSPRRGHASLKLHRACISLNQFSLVFPFFSGFQAKLVWSVLRPANLFSSFRSNSPVQKCCFFRIYVLRIAAVSKPCYSVSVMERGVCAAPFFRTMAYRFLYHSVRFYPVIMCKLRASSFDARSLRKSRFFKGAYKPLFYCEE